MIRVYSSSSTPCVVGSLYSDPATTTVHVMSHNSLCIYVLNRDIENENPTTATTEALLSRAMTLDLS
jgi:hypothetical protein